MAMFSITSAQSQKLTFFLYLFSTTYSDLPAFLSPPFLGAPCPQILLTDFISMTWQFDGIMANIDNYLYYNQYIHRESLFHGFLRPRLAMTVSLTRASELASTGVPPSPRRAPPPSIQRLYGSRPTPWIGPQSFQSARRGQHPILQP